MGLPQNTSLRLGRPKGPIIALGVVMIVVVLSVSVLDWNAERLLDPTEMSAAWKRFVEFIASMCSLDLSADYLSQCLTWTRETVTTAIAGTFLGLILGWILALGASKSVVIGGKSWPSTWPGRFKYIILRTFIELCRLILDVLRGVPDFVWAVIFVAFFGFNRIVGTFAIALSVAGILGKIYSELWDGLPGKRLEPLRTLGANKVVTVFLGIQPLTARAMVSFTLMRAECAIRNASVLGVVVGGGLGGALSDELSNFNYPRVGTVALVIIAVTILADTISNLIRYQIRNDPNHPRVSSQSPKRQITATWIGIFIAVAIAAWAIGDHLVLRTVNNSSMIITGSWMPPPQSDVGRAIDDIQHMSRTGFWDGIQAWAELMRKKLLVPDFSGPSLTSAAKSTATPLGVAVIGTLCGMLLAAFLAWCSSVAYRIEPQRFTGERTSSPVLNWLYKLPRLSIFVIGKSVATVTRAIPEVLWALIIIRLFSFGALSGIIALALHSGGVLARVYTETIDNIPYRRLEQTYLGRSGSSFLGIALPIAWRDWMTYSFFQFESNVRMGVVLGLVGLGGLGSDFKLAYDIFDSERASTLLLTMVVLTTIIDRTSRGLNISRASVR